MLSKPISPPSNFTKNLIILVFPLFVIIIRSNNEDGSIYWIIERNDRWDSFWFFDRVNYITDVLWNKEIIIIIVLSLSFCRFSSLTDLTRKLKASVYFPVQFNMQYPCLMRNKVLWNFKRNFKESKFNSRYCITWKY